MLSKCLLFSEEVLLKTNLDHKLLHLPLHNPFPKFVFHFLGVASCVVRKHCWGITTPFLLRKGAGK